MNIHDPLLTDHGKKQCHVLRHKFPNLSSIELFVASPLRRAIYTALEAFLPDNEKPDGRKLIALPELQELSDVPCDVGSSLADLKAEMEAQGAPVDLTALDENWTEKVRATLNIIADDTDYHMKSVWKTWDHQRENIRTSSICQTVADG